MPVNGNYYSLSGSYTALPDAKYDPFNVKIFYLNVDDYTVTSPDPDYEVNAKFSFNTKPFLILNKNRKIYITQNGKDVYYPVNS